MPHRAAHGATATGERADRATAALAGDAGTRAALLRAGGPAVRAHPLVGRDDPGADPGPGSAHTVGRGGRSTSRRGDLGTRDHAAYAATARVPVGYPDPTGGTAHRTDQRADALAGAGIRDGERGAIAGHAQPAWRDHRHLSAQHAAAGPDRAVWRRGGQHACFRSHHAAFLAQGGSLYDLSGDGSAAQVWPPGSRAVG